MSTVRKVFRHEARNVVRDRWLVAYALFFLVATEALIRFGGGGTRAVLSLGNIALFAAPLVAVVFGSVYLYGAREFTELLLSQPVDRRRLFGGLYLGLAIPLAGALVLGILPPFLVRGGAGVDWVTILVVLGVGVGLTFVFTALAFGIAVSLDEKARGLAVAVTLWLFMTVLYDALVLAIVSVMADYPLEKPLIGLMMLNPVDLGRVMLLMRVDVSALMGYTGAVFQNFFGSAAGTGVAWLALGLWVAIPLGLGGRLFLRKDF